MMRYLRELVVLGSIGVVVAAGAYLVRQNRTLADENRLLARRAVEPRPGLYVPALQASTLDGDPVVLGQVGRRQLLFFFNHSCAYCRASVPAWNTVARRLEGHGIELYGVALDSAGAQGRVDPSPVLWEPQPG